MADGGGSAKNAPQSGPWDDYAAGGPWQQYAQPAEAAGPPNPSSEESPLVRQAEGFASGVGTGIENMASGAVQTIAHPITTAENLYGTGKTAVKLAGQGQVIPAVAEGMKLVGFDEPRLAQLWQQGEGGRAIGEALPMATALAVGGEKAAGRGPLTIGGVPAVQKIPVPSEFIVKHPVLTQGASAVGGALAGKALGGGTEGVGELGGVVGGLRIGRAILSNAEEKLVQEALAGDRDPMTLPPRLMPRYMRELNAQAGVYAHHAELSGEPIENLKIPSGVREAATKMYEERAKTVADTVPSIVSPSEYERSLARLRLGEQGFDPLEEEMHGRAVKVGRANAALSHHTEFGPSRRGATDVFTRTFRLTPRIPPAVRPPK